MGERTYRRWNATNAAARISRRTNAPVTTTIEMMPMAQILGLRRLCSVSSFNTIGSWWVGRYERRTLPELGDGRHRMHGAAR